MLKILCLLLPLFFLPPLLSLSTGVHGATRVGTRITGAYAAEDFVQPPPEPPDEGHTNNPNNLPQPRRSLRLQLRVQNDLINCFNPNNYVFSL